MKDVMETEFGHEATATREVRAIGRESLRMATALLQRVRQGDPKAGIWEAADVQWWSREPRRSDEFEQHFWIAGDRPVAGVLLTDWGDVCQCDPVFVPGTPSVDLTAVWGRACEVITALGPKVVEVPVRADDVAMTELVRRSGFTSSYHDTTAWLDSDRLPEIASLPDGFVLTDRSLESTTPHPAIGRNGAQVEERLRQCSLYDPSLDLAVRTAEGQVAGYSLYWFDPTTEVGLVEPMRVEDTYQRRGLGRAMLTAGVNRLAQKGAPRIKISYGTEAAGALYTGVGFRPTSRCNWYAKM